MADAPTADLLRRIEGGVAWITLNRPDAGNALTSPMRDQLPMWFDEMSGDPNVRCVVLTAAGEKAFCTGADLRQDRTPPPRPEGAPDQIVGDGARVIRQGWQRLIASIQDCEKPVIAAVNGTAAGGGMHLALACDLVLMASEARLISVFVRRGILPDAGGAYLLARLIGPQKAKEVFFFGDDISGARAGELGLVNEVVPRVELENTAAEWAGRLASGPTKAIGFTKFLTNRSLDTDRQGSFWDEGYLQEMLVNTADCTEGIASFMERRPARFKGW